MRCAEITSAGSILIERSKCEEAGHVLREKFGEEVIDYESSSTGVNGYQFDFSRSDRLAWLASGSLIKTSVQKA